MKKLLVLLFVFATAGAGGMIYWSSEQPTTVTFRTYSVERGDLVESISATGTVEPEEVIDVGAQVAGQILTFGKAADGKTVDYGSMVKAGAVLATIDDAIYTSEVSQAEAQVLSAKGGLQRAEADLEQLKAKLRQAERDWKRAKELGPSEALAATTYDNYQASWVMAKANVAVGEAGILQARGSLALAEGMLKRAQRNLGYTTIVSPVTGIIIDRRVNIGQTVVASLNAPSLFLIAKDLTRVQVWVSVNEADIGRLKPGQPVTFTVDAFPGESFRGTVGKVRLNASMTQNVVTYTVEVVADNSSGRLLPYLTANVRFELQRHDGVLMVPAAALRWTPTLEQVSPSFRQGLEVEAATTSQAANENDAATEAQNASAAEQSEGMVWVPDGQFVRPIFVRTGLSDDFMTEVQGEGVAEGLKVVTGLDESSAASAGNSGGSNPFLPKPPSGGRKNGPPPPM